jgi:hypothetical protein
LLRQITNVLLGVLKAVHKNRVQDLLPVVLYERLKEVLGGVLDDSYQLPRELEVRELLSLQSVQNVIEPPVLAENVQILDEERRARGTVAPDPQNRVFLFFGELKKIRVFLILDNVPVLSCVLLQLRD